MTPRERELWTEKLRTTSGITDALHGLLFSEIELKEQTGDVANILFALRQRKDMSSGQLKSITDEMIRRSKLKRDERDFTTDNFLLCGVLVLEDYPSPDHEGLALTFLDDPDDNLRENSAQALGKIGTEKSLPRLRSLAESIKPSPPGKDRLYDQLTESVRAIEGRLQQRSNANREIGTQLLPGVQQKGAGSTARGGAVQSVEDAISHWWRLLIVIAAILGAAWVFLRKAK